MEVSSFFSFLQKIPGIHAVSTYFNVRKSNPTLPDSGKKKKKQDCFLLCCWSMQWYVRVHLCDFLSFCKQPQYEGTSLQPHVSERSTSHLEEFERKIAADENKELQFKELLKQISNKSSEEKKKMEEKVSVFFVLNFLLSWSQEHVFCLQVSNLVRGPQSCFPKEAKLYLW